MELDMTSPQLNLQHENPGVVFYSKPSSVIAAYYKAMSWQQWDFVQKCVEEHTLLRKVWSERRSSAQPPTNRNEHGANSPILVTRTTAPASRRSSVVDALISALPCDSDGLVDSTTKMSAISFEFDDDIDSKDALSSSTPPPVFQMLLSSERGETQEIHTKMGDFTHDEDDDGNEFTDFYERDSHQIELCFCEMSSEMWDVVLQSVKTHIALRRIWEGEKKRAEGKLFELADMIPSEDTDGLLNDLLNQPKGLTYPNVNARSKEGKTPLMCMVERNHLQGVCILLDHGADIHAVDDDGSSALHLAAHHGYDGIVAALLDAGAPLERRNIIGNTPMVHALLACSPKCMKLLLEAKASLWTLPSSGSIPIVIGLKRVLKDSDVVDFGMEEDKTIVLKLLIEHGKNHSGVTALMCATATGNPKWVEPLLRLGANPDAKDSNGVSALMMSMDAVSEQREPKDGWASCVQLLRVNKTDKQLQEIQAMRRRNSGAHLTRPRNLSDDEESKRLRKRSCSPFGSPRKKDLPPLPPKSQ